MTPEGIGEEEVLSGRLYCLEESVTYSGLSGTDMDICLRYLPPIFGV